MPARVIQKSKVEMVLAGVSAAEFPSKQATIISILAQAAGVPEQDVTIMFGKFHFGYAASSSGGRSRTGPPLLSSFTCVPHVSTSSQHLFTTHEITSI